jgi:threonine aldolase
VSALRGFASDNYSGVHPEIVEAILAANEGHVSAYGDDPYTAAARRRFREHFGDRAEAFPVFNGTGANVDAIDAITRPHHAVICAATSHLTLDEAGAPERIAGVKLLPIEAPDGKLTLGLIEEGIDWGRIGDQHASQPRLISIANSTELGTVYTPDEVGALAEFAHAHEMLIHVDGARICNAAAALEVDLAALTTEAGVDVLSFGGTKNGLLLGEAVVFLADGLADQFELVRKQTGQLASKMRFISAQLDALLSGDLWRRNAAHANAMAARLADAITAVEGVSLAHPVEANGVFARLPAPAIEQLEWSADGARAFYVWDEPTGVVRLMCSWDTTGGDVDAFASRLSDTMTR